MMLVTNMLMTIYLGHAKPKPSRFENRMELANDLVTTLAGYHLITFTEFTIDPEIRFQIGWSFVGWLIAMLVCNFAFVLFDLAKSLHLLYVKYSRLYSRYGIQLKAHRRPSLKKELVRPKSLDLKKLDSLRSVLTDPQIEMVRYYSKYNLDLPEELQNTVN
mmetsp:Transcript_26728/g.40759  ORF Transcript_26728/g.40759 Transcript_26728/m.40759 type:complete len:161 (-) Transcript_26728:601-1083(-)